MAIQRGFFNAAWIGKRLDRMTGQGMSRGRHNRPGRLEPDAGRFGPDISGWGLQTSFKLKFDKTVMVLKYGQNLKPVPQF
jgi:hypothetical protein